MYSRIRTKRGVGMSETVMVVGAILVLIGGLFLLYHKLEGTYTLNIGARQFTLVGYAERAEIAQGYLDRSAKLASEQAILDLAKSGGFGKHSKCGQYGGFEFWRNESDVCLPEILSGSSINSGALSDNLGEKIFPIIDNYLNMYPTISLNEFLLLNNFEDLNVDLSDGFELSSSGRNYWRFGELYFTQQLDFFPLQGAEKTSLRLKDKVMIKIDGKDVWFTNDWHNPREGGVRYHQGIDIMAPLNMPIVAARGGTVKYSGCNRYGGNRVGIIDDEGNYFYYAHLDTIKPKMIPGARVEAGEVLGTTGDTIGCLPDCSGLDCGIKGKTEPHLHFGIYVNPTDQEDTQKQPAAYNPYYALCNTINPMSIFEYAGFPSSEYRHIPKFDINLNYNPNDYLTIKSDFKKLLDSCGPKPYCFAKKLADPRMGIENIMTSSQGSTDLNLNLDLNSNPIPPLHTTQADATQASSNPPAEEEESGNFMGADASGVAGFDDSNLRFEPKNLFSEFVVPEDKSGFDWLIEYNGMVISSDDHGLEQEKWNMYCESPNERVVADIAELFYNCTFSEDVDCVCSSFPFSNTFQTTTYNSRQGFDNKYMLELQAAESLDPLSLRSNPEPVIPIKRYLVNGIIGFIPFTYGNPWFPSKVDINNGYEMTFFDDISGSSRIKRSAKGIHLSKRLIGKTNTNPGTIDIQFMEELGNGNILRTVREDYKVNKDDATSCSSPKVIKVCVLNWKSQFVRNHRVKDGNSLKEVVDFAPVVYRFAYHLPEPIPKPIENVEIQDKFRLGNSVVLKWPESNYVETYNIYYAKWDLTTRTPQQLADLAKETTAGSATPGKEVYVKPVLTADIIPAKGDVNINYMYHHIPKDNPHADEHYYVSTFSDAAGNDNHKLVELVPSKFYKFDTNLVYTLTGLDNVNYYFAIIPMTKKGKTHETVPNIYSGTSVDDAPPPMKDYNCEVNDEIVCTFTNPFNGAVDSFYTQVYYTSSTTPEITSTPLTVDPPIVTVPLDSTKNFLKFTMHSVKKLDTSLFAPFNPDEVIELKEIDSTLDATEYHLVTPLVSELRSFDYALFDLSVFATP